MGAKKSNTKPERVVTIPETISPADLLNRGEMIYNQTKKSVTNGYDKTSRIMSRGYGYAGDYGRQNPGKMTLLILTAGLGLIYVLKTPSRHAQPNRYIRPVVDALTDIAQVFFR